MNTAILRMPSTTSTWVPALATAAPPIPPTRAWDDDVGRPRKNVIRFSEMAPTRPEKITPIDSTSWVTTSLAMVSATWVPNMRNATKLKVAAQTTAQRGESTRVETIVAIELAASWKPFTKSKPSATRTTSQRRRVSTG